MRIFSKLGWVMIVVLIGSIVAGMFAPRFRVGPQPPPTKLLPPPDSLVHDPKILERADTVVLVRVVELDMQKIPFATMLVLKSWKGSFSAGRSLHAPSGVVCAGIAEDCALYQFQPRDQGKEFLIMSRGELTEPDGTKMPALQPDGVWPVAESQALMAALNEAVTAAQQGEPR